MLRSFLVVLVLVVLPTVAAAQDAVLDLGDSFSGVIDSPFDLDVVAFEGVAGTLLTATASGKQGFHPSLQLVDLSTGQPVDVTGFVTGAGGAKVSLKKLPLPTTGGYELRLGPSDETLGPYKLTTKGKITKPLKSFTADGASEPGVVLDFAALPGTRLTATVKAAKGFAAIPDVPLLDGPDGPLNLASATELTLGKVPKAKVKDFTLPLLGSYTLTPLEASAPEGDFPPLATTVKLTFPKVVKSAVVEKPTFANNNLELVSQSTGGAAGDGNSLDASISFDGHAIAFVSHATTFVHGAGGPLLSADTDIFVRDLLAQTTVVASAPTGKNLGAGGSESPAIDGAGTVVAFVSSASSLVTGDDNGSKDVFVRDLLTLETTRVSVADGGGQAHGDSTEPEISGDGRYVVFASVASDLVAGDGNGTKDIFLHDRELAVTQRVSVGDLGAEAHGSCSEPVLSHDGLHVAFTSSASDLLAPGLDTNGKSDVYVKHLATGLVQRVSLTAGGEQTLFDANAPSISADGRFVAFVSAGKFTPDDGNVLADVFVKDLLTGAVDLVSVGSDGTSGNNHSVQPQLSASGQLVLFRTQATNLVPGGDANGFLGDVLLRDRPAGTTVRVDLDAFGQQADGDCFAGDLAGDGSHAAFFGLAENLTPGGDANDAFDVWVRS